ncbi:ABC1 kinase family protein [Bacillus rubiinfantis]|uniref:ABC1 kinase family protein n=1 Tax=Bacillus rubiinfantis TaxID=1499680 RepID=UPI0006946863|nr:AarF/UbiB family protein [Bacillus rubiinfantis]
MGELIRLMRNKRFRKTFFMFFRFFVQFWWLGRLKRFLSKEKSEQRYRKIYAAQADTFTKTAIELGGLLIKLGQFVSSRVDILPKEYTDKLSQLQDSVAPIATEATVKRIEEEFSLSVADLFTSFSKQPVAAASLGQVHKAVLKNGDTVAVKVMRPGIENIVGLDLATFKLLTNLAQRFTKIGKFVDLVDVYDEFKEVISDELNYLTEAKHLEAFRKQFQDFPGVAAPNLYHDFTTSKVLVMEFIEGVKINELDKLSGNGVNQKKLAAILYLSYLKQIMEDGIFHADPHPGNLLVKQDGTLVYIDFGMVGLISEQMKDNIVKLALAIYMKDPGGMVEAFDKLGFLRKQADKSALARNIKVILSNFTEDGFKIDSLQNEEFLEELREFLYQQPFQIPARTTFLGKAIMSVFSICNGLDKEFNLVKLTKPYVEDLLVSDDDNMQPVKNRLLDQAKDSLLSVIPAVRKLIHLVDQMESGEFRLAPSRSYEKRVAQQQAFQTRKMIMAMFGTGVVIAGSQLFDQHTSAGMIMMIGGALITLLQVATQRTTQRRRRPHPSFSGKK